MSEVFTYMLSLTFAFWEANKQKQNCFLPIFQLTSNEPAEDEEWNEAAPGAPAVAATLKDGEQQGHHSNHQQVDGNKGLPGTVMEVQCSF